MCHYVKNQEPFAFAGLWEEWRNVELGDVLHTFTIITTEPKALIRPIHNRMPVIYDAEIGQKWLVCQYSGSVSHDSRCGAAALAFGVHGSMGRFGAGQLTRERFGSLHLTCCAKPARPQLPLL
jgi:hypothetical protein